MTNITGLEKKEFVVIIRWVVDADVLLSEGTENVLDQLREVGSAEITDLQLQDKDK